MDTPTVIQLSCQAAESVLRFRAASFTGRPMIDLQMLRETIATKIQKTANEDDNHFSVPLAEVTNYAGIGAAAAVHKWNEISYRENHIALVWFCNCVCSLVGGVVTDIGSAALTDLGINAALYLDLDSYNPFCRPGSSTAESTETSSPYVPGRGNVDSSEAPRPAGTEQPEGADISPVPSIHPRSPAAGSTSPEADLPHDEAGKKSATYSEARGAHAQVVTATKRPVNVPHSPSGSASLESMPSRPAKRTRLPDSAPKRPFASTSSAGTNASSSFDERASSSADSKSPRLIPFTPWNRGKTNTSMEAEGRRENWDTTHEEGITAGIGPEQSSEQPSKQKSSAREPEPADWECPVHDCPYEREHPTTSNKYDHLAEIHGYDKTAREYSVDTKHLVRKRAEVLRALFIRDTRKLAWSKAQILASEEAIRAADYGYVSRHGLGLTMYAYSIPAVSASGKKKDPPMTMLIAVRNEMGRKGRLYNQTGVAQSSWGQVYDDLLSTFNLDRDATNRRAEKYLRHLRLTMGDDMTQNVTPAQVELTHQLQLKPGASLPPK